MVWLGLMITVLGLLSFFFQRSHLLSLLLLMEVLNLGLIMALVDLVFKLGVPSYYCLIFLTVIVCEAALGLSLLVLIVRNLGNDYVTSFGILKY